MSENQSIKPKLKLKHFLKNIFQQNQNLINVKLLFWDLWFLLEQTLMTNTIWILLQTQIKKFRLLSNKMQHQAKADSLALLEWRNSSPYCLCFRRLTQQHQHYKSAVEDKKFMGLHITQVKFLLDIWKHELELPILYVLENTQRSPRNTIRRLRLCLSVTHCWFQSVSCHSLL